MTSEVSPPDLLDAARTGALSTVERLIANREQGRPNSRDLGQALTLASAAGHSAVARHIQRHVPHRVVWDTLVDAMNQANLTAVRTLAPLLSDKKRGEALEKTASSPTVPVEALAALFEHPVPETNSASAIIAAAQRRREDVVALLLPRISASDLAVAFHGCASSMMLQPPGGTIADFAGGGADILSAFVPLQDLMSLPPGALGRLPRARARLESAALEKTLPPEHPSRARARM